MVKTMWCRTFVDFLLFDLFVSLAPVSMVNTFDSSDRFNFFLVLFSMIMISSFSPITVAIVYNISIINMNESILFENRMEKTSKFEVSIRYWKNLQPIEVAELFDFISIYVELESWIQLSVQVFNHLTIQLKYSSRVRAKHTHIPGRSIRSVFGVLYGPLCGCSIKDCILAYIMYCTVHLSQYTAFPLRELVYNRRNRCCVAALIVW